ncbi:hypothetical protein [Sporosalibacterium faouarense]|uniref:hypothetical protein n=1 Tax=Sporosalibacterium faouarense TaxID=516123 RepID=UPI00192C6DAD|nr:hypothetical protein [Sporosalibacterium faouarense]
MNTTFNQRIGLDNLKSISNDFPQESRNALFCIISEFVAEDAVRGLWTSIRKEIYRSSRKEFHEVDSSEVQKDVKCVLADMRWDKVYVFCERFYKNLLKEIVEYGFNNDEEIVETEAEVKDRFEEEVNNILCEDNIEFEFKKGEFFRRGRAITQKNTQRVGSILTDKKMYKVKKHYNKALNFFRDYEKPDYENTIKESICALELALEILTGENTSKDFATNIQKYQGKAYDKIPSPITQGIIKIFGYRGRADGVAHGIDKGLRVSEFEAELMLNITASYITYLYDFFTKLEDLDCIPF